MQNEDFSSWNSWREVKSWQGPQGCIPRDSKKGSIGMPEDSKQGLIGSLGMPDSEEGDAKLRARFHPWHPSVTIRVKDHEKGSLGIPKREQWLS